MDPLTQVLLQLLLQMLLWFLFLWSPKSNKTLLCSSIGCQITPNCIGALLGILVLMHIQTKSRQTWIALQLPAKSNPLVWRWT